MKHFKRLAHAVWECKYNIVWCLKYRFKILTGDVGNSVRDIIKQLCEWGKIKILKGKSAIKIFDRHLELKRRYWGRHFWAKGY